MAVDELNTYKSCSKCNQIKPLIDFRTIPNHRCINDKAGICKICEAFYQRQFYREHQEERKKYVSEWVQKHKEKHALSVRKWSHNHTDIIKVQSATLWKAKTGNLDVCLTEFCETCPIDDLNIATQRHHPDYNYPDIIVSCCAHCHRYLNSPYGSLLAATKLTGNK